MNTRKSKPKNREKLEFSNITTSLGLRYRINGKRMPIIPLDPPAAYLVTNTEKDNLSYYRFL